MSTALDSLVFLRPWWLLVVGAVVAAVFFDMRRPASSIVLAPSPGFLGIALEPSRRARLFGLPSVLQWGGLAVLAVALAEPAAKIAESRTAIGVDVMFCLDRSSSMTEKPIGTASSSRFDAARQEASRFVRRRPTDRFGLVTFARHADLACPPTLDHEAFRSLLDLAQPIDRSDAEDATGIGRAVASCAVTLAETDAPQRVVILLTDGRENVATDMTPQELGPGAAATLCRELGVTVHVMDVGAIGEPSERLAGMAEATGGRIFRSGSAEELAEAYAALDSIHPSGRAETVVKVESMHVRWLLLGLLLACIGRVLELTVLEILP